MLKKVNVLHSVPSDGDVIEHQAVYEGLLHPPENLGFPHHTVGGHADVLEGDAVQVPGSPPPPLLLLCPGLDPLHQYLEVLEGGAGVLHHDIPEGHRVASTALSLPSHVEERATAPVMPVCSTN